MPLLPGVLAGERGGAGAGAQVRRGAGGDLQEVPIPPEVKAVVVLNLQSYAGGRDVWGLATDPAKLARLGLRVPIFNDGLLEVPPPPPPPPPLSEPTSAIRVLLQAHVFAGEHTSRPQRTRLLRSIERCGLMRCNAMGVLELTAVQ